MRLTKECLLVLVLGLIGCGSNDIKTEPDASLSFMDGGGIDYLPNSICRESVAPSACGILCDSDSACSRETFCNDGICDAVCLAGGFGCDADSDCESGRCIPRRPDAGPGDGGIIGCTTVEVSAERVIGNIMLVVDASESMAADFEGNLDAGFPDPGTCVNVPFVGQVCNDFTEPSRWNAVKGALADAGGLVPQLESIVRFGFAAYTTSASVCPKITGVDLAFDNSSAINASFEAARPGTAILGGGTPTGDAVDAVLNRITSSSSIDGPTALVLATDGEPNSCAGDSQAVSESKSVAAVERARAAGIPTYVLGVGQVEELRGHFQDLANAGAGGQQSPFWTADNPGALAEALSDIVGASIPCTVDLGKTIDTNLACRGTVTINDEPLECDNAARGWKVVDEDTIELLGTACREWQTNERTDLAAEFPCEVIVE